MEVLNDNLGKESVRSRYMNRSRISANNITAYDSVSSSVSVSAKRGFMRTLNPITAGYVRNCKQRAPVVSRAVVQIRRYHRIGLMQLNGVIRHPTSTLSTDLRLPSSPLNAQPTHRQLYEPMGSQSHGHAASAAITDQGNYLRAPCGKIPWFVIIANVAGHESQFACVSRVEN